MAGRGSGDAGPRCGSPTTASNTRRGSPAGQGSAVELFAARQHRDELFRARNPRLRLLRGLHPPAEGVAVGAVERVEEGFRLAVARQRRRQLAGNIHSCGTLVGGVPATVGLCRLDRSEEHTSELQSLMSNSYAVFCLKTKTTS